MFLLYSCSPNWVLTFPVTESVGREPYVEAFPSTSPTPLQGPDGSPKSRQQAMRKGQSLKCLWLWEQGSIFLWGFSLPFLPKLIQPWVLLSFILSCLKNESHLPKVDKDSSTGWGSAIMSQKTWWTIAFWGHVLNLKNVLHTVSLLYTPNVFTLTDLKTTLTIYFLMEATWKMEKSFFFCVFVLSLSGRSVLLDSSNLQYHKLNLFTDCKWFLQVRCVNLNGANRGCLLAVFLH